MKRRERKDYERQIEKLNQEVKGLADGQVAALAKAKRVEDALSRSRANERAALRKVEELEDELANARRRLFVNEGAENG